MRGKAVPRKTQLLRNGITPAYAGKSCRRYVPAGNVEDHPRLCGEKFTHLRAFFHFVGSPPPMRGKDVLSDDADPLSGITPAYAGKRCRKKACGET